MNKQSWDAVCTFSVHANILKPQRAAILAIQPLLAIRKAARNATRALRAVRTIEEGYVLVSNVAEPMDLALVFEQAERNTVNRCITPALVKEATGTVKVIEVVAILFAAPEA